MLIREHERCLAVLDIDVARDIFSGVLCQMLVETDENSYN
jgi:hypothetical protein